MTSRPLRAEVTTLCLLAPIALALVLAEPIARFIHWRNVRRGAYRS